MTDSKTTKTKTINEIAAKHLGQSGGVGYKDTYDPSLLVRIPRSLNRKAYGLTGQEFKGVDTWNAYEVSAITSKGLPVNGMLKIVCSADSKYHVESKSIKLYLNSFNMTPFGDSAAECIQGIVQRVQADLDELLETKTTVSFYGAQSQTHPKSFSQDYKDLSTLVDLDTINFSSFQSNASQLEVGQGKELKVQSDLLRSVCRVTQQPDWGDVFIHIQGETVPSAESLAKYIVSHRTVNHFHEEVCEMIYAHLTERFKPNKLMVACLYTRRGGIDINPIRASDESLIPEFFTNPNYIIQKTLRQ